MIRKLTITNGNYNMGLLDYFNQGKQWLQNQPQMADPHANARALMGGQAMQYNQQPQSLIAEQVNAPTTQASFTPQPPTEQQTQQMTYQGTPQAGVNYPNYDSSAINPYLDGDQTDGTGGYVDTSYNNRINSAPVNSLLMGNAQTPQGVVGVDSNAVYKTQVDNDTTTRAYPEPPNITGEAFDPSLTEEEKRLREEALSRLPWYLGGKR